MTQIDKYTYSEDPAVVAGACLGFGLCCCSIRSELDPAFALLSEHVHRCELNNQVWESPHDSTCPVVSILKKKNPFELFRILVSCVY